MLAREALLDGQSKCAFLLAKEQMSGSKVLIIFLFQVFLEGYLIALQVSLAFSEAIESP